MSGVVIDVFRTITRGISQWPVGQAEKCEAASAVVADGRSGGRSSDFRLHGREQHEACQWNGRGPDHLNRGPRHPSDYTVGLPVGAIVHAAIWSTHDRTLLLRGCICRVPRSCIGPIKKTLKTPLRRMLEVINRFGRTMNLMASTAQQSG